MKTPASHLLVWLSFLLSPILAGDEPRVLRVISTFAEDTIAGPALSPVTYWRWSVPDKANAGTFSQLERADLPGAVDGRGLKVTIPHALPAGLDFYALWSTGLDYLPPETTAIRMRVRVVSGRFTLSAGGPTAYFATSDVRARPQVLEPETADGGWRTVTLSLISDLERNYRRPIFSSESPVIYYTRWIQEPMRLLVGADSTGELWIDGIELIGTGEGRDFPVFADGEVRPLAKADFGTAFTFATDDREFDLSHTPGKEAVRKPAVLRTNADSRGSLEAIQRGLEEMSFIGVKMPCPEDTNALRLTLTMTHEGPFDELAIDVLALVSPDGKFQAEMTAAAQPAPGGFDYCLSPQRTAGVSWGFYHARRAVKNGKREILVIPFSDFVCAYGNGELRDRLRLQQALPADEVSTVALVSPFRQGRAETRFLIEAIEAVSVTESQESRVSYPQVPDVSAIRLEVVPGALGKEARQVKDN